MNLACYVLLLALAGTDDQTPAKTSKAQEPKELWRMTLRIAGASRWITAKPPA